MLNDILLVVCVLGSLFILECFFRKFDTNVIAEWIAYIIFIIIIFWSATAFGNEIREPISKNAKIVEQTALEYCATYYPEERLKDNGDHWEKIDDQRLYKYYNAMDIYVRDKGGNAAYSSCTQFVCAVLASTVDPDAWKGSFGCQAFILYGLTNPLKYQFLGNIPFAALRPGDIVASNHHTAIYSGSPIPGMMIEAGYTTHSYPGTDLWYTLGRHTLGELSPWNEYLIFRIK